ncbi:SDR family oxidoreductase [Nocardioides yefusunii]|uniref:SDR family oxidoreductase n=1 Tax=Nocardioides yefusunii TaxID=2500546 RepID=A0ABW1QVM6_9ACTN|nr:SDR family oxidoreductase [Nocardioides yefusunii]
MDLLLTDRVHIVTGGTRGLGRASAEALVAEGAKVVISSRDADAVARTVAALGADNAVGLACDNADPDTPQALVDLALAHFGRLDGALVSVGGPAAGTALSAADEDWRSAFESVFLGAVRLAREVSAHLGDGGAIAFVLSTSVKSPVAGLGISNGLRPGLAMVAKEMADELGARGIRVNTLLPGRIDTDRVRELDATRPDPDAARASWEQKIPLGRYGRPEEFGAAAAFLMSPRAGFVTGVQLPIDGGLLPV